MTTDTRPALSHKTHIPITLHRLQCGNFRPKLGVMAEELETPEVADKLASSHGCLGTASCFSPACHSPYTEARTYCPTVFTSCISRHAVLPISQGAILLSLLLRSCCICTQRAVMRGDATGLQPDSPVCWMAE